MKDVWQRLNDTRALYERTRQEENADRDKLYEHIARMGTPQFWQLAARCRLFFAELEIKNLTRSITYASAQIARIDEATGNIKLNNYALAFLILEEQEAELPAGNRFCGYGAVIFEFQQSNMTY